jgi:hypothetical protein
VCEERVADDNMIMIKGSKFAKATTLLLRGANDYMLDEMDRALHDALCVIKVRRAKIYGIRQNPHFSVVRFYVTLRFRDALTDFTLQSTP